MDSDQEVSFNFSVKRWRSVSLDRYGRLGNLLPVPDKAEAHTQPLSEPRVATQYFSYVYTHDTLRVTVHKSPHHHQLRLFP